MLQELEREPGEDHEKQSNAFEGIKEIPLRQIVVQRIIEVAAGITIIEFLIRLWPG